MSENKGRTGEAVSKNTEPAQAAAIENPLGTKPLGRLLFSLAVPTAIANVVNALYNIVDQIFIGQGVGTLGNAATSVSFPLSTICMALGLMLGLGAASGFNLELGRGNAKGASPEAKKDHEDQAKKIVASAVTAMVLSGIIIAIVVGIFLKPMLIAFGATPNILPYAEETADQFKNINWNELNRKYKRNYAKALSSVIEERGLDREALEAEMNRVYEVIKTLDLTLGRGKGRP